MPDKSPGLARGLARGLLSQRTRSWSEHPRLITVEDRGNWVIHWEMLELRRAAQRLGARCAKPFWIPFSRNQCIFYGSQFFLLADDWVKRPHKICTAYFHGKPGSGVEEFDQLFQQLTRHHHQVDRIQVSHSEMEEVLLESGIAAHKLKRIPIGIHADRFLPQSAARKAQLREQLGLEPDDVVVGSFQKDGQGWGEGMNPKLIKGPDTFVAVMKNLRQSIPKLKVLLSGPARGYVKQGLADAGVPWVHHELEHYFEVAEMYQCLDAYLVASRQEGGPKAVLESMASGIPLVSTRVGQAMDLVRDGENGWLCDVDDVEGLSERLLHIFRHSEDLEPVLSEARKTAEQCDYPQLDPLWDDFFEGLLEKNA